MGIGKKVFRQRLRVGFWYHADPWGLRDWQVKLMAEELPDLLKESRQRQAYGQAKLSPADMRDLILHDTGNKDLADQIERELLMQEASRIGQPQT